jgi:hypothetical protein
VRRTGDGEIRSSARSNFQTPLAFAPRRTFAHAIERSAYLISAIVCQQCIRAIHSLTT